jgi:ribonuclease BN (tRNA processing enzyme)
LRDSGLPTKGLDRILLTGSSINNIGGLINTLLATQDRLSYECPINVYGPPSLSAFLQTIRKSFQYLSKFEFVKLNLINEKISWQEILNDQNCRIFGCAISDNPSEGDKTIYPRLAISYAFKLREPLRRVSINAMNELGVPDDIFQKLVQECQMGNSVSLPSGKMVSF